MKLFDVLKGAAKIAGTLHPGVGAAIGLVNGLLPKDKQLPVDATGEDVLSATKQLTPEQQSKILNQEFEYKMKDLEESHSTLRTMLASDATNPQTTRPKMAYQAFVLTAVITLMVMTGWLWGVFKSSDPLTSINNSYPLVLALVGPFVTLMLAYFGILRKEHQNKLAVLSNNKVEPPRNIVDALAAFTKGR